MFANPQPTYWKIKHAVISILIQRNVREWFYEIERGNVFIAEVNFFHGGRVIPVFDKYLYIVWLYRG